MTTAVPFADFRAIVSPEWVDHNGHMGIRSYSTVFDQAVRRFYNHIGITRQAIAASGGTIFALQECNWFRREVMLGDPLRVTSQLIDVDHSKVVTFHTLHQTRDDYIAAYNEIIEIHIDRETRKPSPFPPEIAERLAATLRDHAALERPAPSGRGIAIPR